jgi:RND family efflux transporter MFP subunit
MTTIQFLAEWALRSSILILTGALLLWALRVKDPSVRLAAWTAMLCGSLAMPLFTAMAPRITVAMIHTGIRTAPQPVEAPLVKYAAAPDPVRGVTPQETNASKPFDWARAAVTIYVLAAGALLMRLCFGLAMSLRLLRGSRATDRATHGIEIRESDRVATPVVLGIARPAIVLPGDWRRWDGAKLDAVLAHERSHIRRRDPAVQLLSAIHRALLWHSPLSWFLHRRIVRVAEEASDDAAVAVTRDRALYAEVLLDFMRRSGGARKRGAIWQGVPMARYGRADERIHRILDGTALSRGVTRWSAAAILVLGAPLAYLVAAAQPQSAPQAQVARQAQAAQPQIAPQAQVAPMAQAATDQGTAIKAPVLDALPVKPSRQNSGEVSAAGLPGGRLMAPQIAAQSAAAARPAPVPVYLNGLGNVAAFYTVTVKPRVDGQLMSVSFNEGGLVRAGQVLASIDPQPYQIQLAQAEGQLIRDQAALKNARADLDRLEKLVAQNAIPKSQVDAQTGAVAQLEGSVRADQASVDNAQLQLSYTQVTAPITGVASLRLVDPGNIVHAADAAGILIIAQLDPIAVLFTIPEDSLPLVLARLREGASVPVEARKRDDTAKIATGHLTAVDNQIDQTTGTAKLKAVFDNKDGALFPGEFVIVHLLVK